MSNDANSNSASQIKFTKFLAKANEPNRLRQRVTITILRHAKQEGSFSACFGHRKKKTFMEKALLIFSMRVVC